MPTKPRSVRDEIRDWLRTELTKGVMVKMPALVKKAVAHFQRDEAFLRRFAADGLADTVQMLAYGVIHELRGPLDIRLPTGRAVEVAASIWARWNMNLEHVGDRYIPFPDLTKGAGLIAAAELDVQAAGFRQHATLLRRAVERLSPGQCIKDCWTPPELDALRAEIERGSTEGVA